jgi:hypothetical protein
MYHPSSVILAIAEHTRSVAPPPRQKVIGESAQYLEEPPIEHLVWNGVLLTWWRDQGAAWFPRLLVIPASSHPMNGVEREPFALNVPQ